jgi:uncharacterized repeat protein (TIGR04076 family)
MKHPADVRITVMRRTQNLDFQRELTDAGEWAACQMFHDGQEFISSGWMPEGFCSYAWADILEYVLTLARGGNMVGVKRGTFVSNCTDGFRPVFFKLERIEEPDEQA